MKDIVVKFLSIYIWTDDTNKFAKRKAEKQRWQSSRDRVFLEVLDQEIESESSMEERRSFVLGLYYRSWKKILKIRRQNKKGNRKKICI